MENTETVTPTTGDQVVENKGFDSLEAIMADEKLGKLITSHTDSAIGKAIDAYKTKGFAEAVEKAVQDKLKQQATKTPEQIKMDEYEAKLNTMSEQIKTKELSEMRLTNRSKASKELSDAGLPLELADFLVSEDSEKTEANVKKAMDILTKFATDTKQNVLKGNNVKVPGKTTTSGKLQEPGENASKAEWMAYWKQRR